VAVAALIAWPAVARHLATRALVMELARPLVNDDAFKGAGVGAIDGWMAARRAALRQEDPVVKRLLDAGADPNARTSDYPPGSFWNGLRQIAVRLIHHRTPARPTWSTVLGSAIDHDSADVAAVLAHGGNPRLPVDSEDDYPLSKVMWGDASQEERVAELTLLLRYGAVAHSKDGDDAVAAAGCSGDVAAIGLLLQHGADSMTGRYNGTSAARWAICSYRADVLQFLQSHGATVDRSEGENDRVESGINVVEIQTPQGRRNMVVTGKLGDFIDQHAADPDFKAVVRVLRAHGVKMR
jgi:hypothetical protein